MQKRLTALSLLLLLFLLFSSFSAAAEEAQGIFRIAEAPTTVRRGASFRISLSPAQAGLSAFVLFVEYDPSDIEQASAAFSDALKGDYTYTSAQEGRLAVVYTAKDGEALPADGQITITFRTSADALSDTLPIRFTVTDAAAEDASALLSEPEVLEVEPAFAPEPSADSRLLSLTPPAGTLVPAFDLDVFEYTLDVPFTSASLVFDAVPAEGASVRVNRKNLGAGGSSVDFSFTVTAADGVTKSVYTVSVTRLEKDSTTSAAGTAAGGTSGSSGRGGTSSSSKDTGDADASAASDGADRYAESAENAPEDTLPGDGGANTVYSGAGMDVYALQVDRFSTAALVLLGVGVGMAIVILVQRFGKKPDSDKKDK